MYVGTGVCVGTGTLARPASTARRFSYLEGLGSQELFPKLVDSPMQL
jgi:hypothetical protein